MAAEYIEREALLDAIFRLPPKMDEDGYGWLGRRGVWQTICDFSAADVRPVARGEWIVCGDGDSVPYMCSHCGKTAPANLIEKWGADFCPTCGADMREKN